MVIITTVTATATATATKREGRKEGGRYPSPNIFGYIVCILMMSVIIIRLQNALGMTNDDTATSE